MLSNWVLWYLLHAWRWTGSEGRRVAQWLSVCLPLAQVVLPGSWDPVPHPTPYREPASPSAYVSVSQSVSGEQINKNLKKKKREEQSSHWGGRGSIESRLTRKEYRGMPGSLNGCVYLQLRSWSWASGIESCIRLPTGSLLLPVPMSLPHMSK